MEEHGLWEIWNKFGARLMWTAALKDTQTEAERQAVQQKLGELPARHRAGSAAGERPVG